MVQKYFLKILRAAAHETYLERINDRDFFHDPVLRHQADIAWEAFRSLC